MESSIADRRLQFGTNPGLPKQEEKSRLWIVSELYYPEETSTGYILTRLAEGLAARRAVRVICAQPSYALRGQRFPRNEMRHGVQIERCAEAKFDKNHLLLRFVDLLIITLRIGWRVFWKIRGGDKVLVVTNPPILPFVVGAACRLRRAHFLLLIHDVYPEVLVATGVTRSGGWLPSIIDRASIWLYRTADRVIVLGRDMQAIVRNKLADRDDRIVVIPNWADSDDIRPRLRQENQLLDEAGLLDRFVIQYAGNMGRTHGIELLVACAEVLMHQMPTVHFLFIGSGAKKGWLEEEVSKRGLVNVSVMGNRPRSDQDLFINACDVAVISFVQGMAGVSVPSRMYNIMAAGKAIIAVADAESELAQVVLEERAGWVVAPDDIEGFVMTVVRAANDPGELALRGRNARRAAESKYPFEAILTQYETLLNDVESA